MAQKFGSPGVYTTEVDQSFLAQAILGVGAAFIGRTTTGPAFVPIVVSGFDSFAQLFGDVSPKMQLPYSVKNYLKNSGVAVIMRVLGSSDGLATTNGYVVGGISALVDAQATGSVLAVLHHSGTVSVVQVSGVAADANNFVVKIGAAFAATASFLTSSQNYIGKVLNTDPTLYGQYGHYLAQNFKYVKPAASASFTVVGEVGAVNSFTRDYEAGVTPWIKSQPVGGVEFNLFRFKTTHHGRATNDDFKVEIANVKPSVAPTVNPYGTFDIVIRDFYDTDQRPSILESFVGCTMDPASRAYVVRRIGDQEESFDTVQRKFTNSGTFPLRSKFVKIETDATANSPAEAIPWGHRGYLKATFLNQAFVPDMPLTLNQNNQNGTVDPTIRWGISFVSGGIADRMRALPGAAATSTDGEFSLAFLTSSFVNGRQFWQYQTGTVASQQHFPVYSSASLYKFDLPFQGGFDGFDLRVSDPLFLNNSDDETVIGVVSLKRAVDAVANPDWVDYNLISLPGVHNIKVTDYTRQMVNTRQDALYIMDATGSSVQEVIQNLGNRQIDDNYTGIYYPDLKITDRSNNKTVRVSPSVAVMGAMAFSDRIGQVFFAPAGLNRGGLGQFDVTDVADRLTFQDRNDLYDNRINPIATFPNEGIVVFGQKTLQLRASALDRINVRRLLIFARRSVSAAAKFLLFEPNNPSSWQRFTNTVNPILEKIRQDQGIERFKVVMDSSTNTSDLVDRNIMTGKIFLQPTRATEFIDLSFIITTSGVTFGQ